MRLVIFLLGIALGSNYVIGQTRDTLTYVTTDSLTGETHVTNMIFTTSYVSEKGLVEGKKHSLVITSGATLPVDDFGSRGVTPMVGYGTGYAHTGRTVGLAYTNYFYKGLGITASLEYKRFIIDYGSYNHALNLSQNSPMQGVVCAGSDEAWNIFSMAVGPSFRVFFDKHVGFHGTALVGYANSRIPKTQIHLAGDYETHAERPKIIMNSENSGSIFYKFMIGPLFALNESVTLSFGFGMVFGLRPSFSSHDFIFHEDGGRSPRKTTYPMLLGDLSIGLGYNF